MFPRDIQLTDFVYNPVTRLSLSPSLSFSAVFLCIIICCFSKTVFGHGGFGGEDMARDRDLNDGNLHGPKPPSHNGVRGQKECNTWGGWHLYYKEVLSSSRGCRLSFRQKHDVTVSYNSLTSTELQFQWLPGLMSPLAMLTHNFIHLSRQHNANSTHVVFVPKYWIYAYIIIPTLQLGVQFEMYK